MYDTITTEEAEREKRAAALASVGAAFLLTAMKFAVGVSTNSLGILSEAAHSGLDLLAAGVTYGAVRYASLPPDPGHPYGHGKMENLSALVEAVLLLVTCGWIIWESIDRLFFNPAVVDHSLWAVGVMLVSIYVDVTRSRMLKRVAKKYRSQALEADALHFSTDILSSVVVLAGLAGLYAASFLPPDSTAAAWLRKSDAGAALGVAGIVIYVSLALGRRAVNVLLDAGDGDASERIRSALKKLPESCIVERLRLRHSGPDLFVDIVLSVSSALTLEQAHAVQEEAAKLVKAVERTADISIQLIPLDQEGLGAVERIRSLAAADGLFVHGVEYFDGYGEVGSECRQLAELHVELPPQTPLGEAHEKVSAFERKLRGVYPGLAVVSHLEPASDGETLLEEPKEAGVDSVRAAVASILVQEKQVSDCHNVRVFSCGDRTYASFHCRMRADATVREAHETASRIQAALHASLPRLSRVTVHMEPVPDGGVSRS